MNEDLTKYFVELKPGFLSVYPSLSEIDEKLKWGLVPWFDVKFMDNQIRSYAIVDRNLAMEGLAYNRLMDRLGSSELKSNFVEPLAVFRATKPALKAMMDLDDYSTISQLFTGFLLKLDSQGNGSFKQVARIFKELFSEKIKSTSNEKLKSALQESIDMLDELA